MKKVAFVLAIIIAASFASAQVINIPPEAKSIATLTLSPYSANILAASGSVAATISYGISIAYGPKIADSYGQSTYLVVEPKFQSSMVVSGSSGLVSYQGELNIGILSFMPHGFLIGARAPLFSISRISSLDDSGNPLLVFSTVIDTPKATFLLGGYGYTLGQGDRVAKMWISMATTLGYSEGVANLALGLEAGFGF